MLDNLMYICGALVVAGGLWFGYLDASGGLTNQRVLALCVLYGALFFLLAGSFLYFLQKQLIAQEAAKIQAAQSASSKVAQQLSITERPWLTVEVIPSGPLISSGDVVKLSVTYRIRNIGHSPGNKATLYARFFVTGIEAQKYVLEEQKILCENLAASPQINPTTIFPDTPPTLFDWEYSVVKNENLIESVPNTTFPVIFLIGCVDYVFGEPPTHHQTRFIYMVMRKNPRIGANPMGIAIGEDVPKNQVVLIKPTFGGDYAN